MSNDPIADMFSRIKNAAKLKKENLRFSYSKIKFEIAKFLEKQGFLKAVYKKGKGCEKNILVTLGYENNGRHIEGLRRISKLSRRIYKGYREIPFSRAGRERFIISTNKGIMDERTAKKGRLGGEVLGEIW